MKLLLADKDHSLLDLSAYALRREGFDVVAVDDGATALQKWRDEAPDLILMDLSLPRLDGLEVLRRIREDASAGSEIPVILMTERSDEEDVMTGFAAGADDYVIKPFSHRQVAARIRAITRRRMSLREPQLELRAAGLVIDCQSHEAWREGAPETRQHLRPVEFRLLRVLAENVGRVVPTERLVESAWGFGDGDASMLKTHVSHLRAKLGLRPGDRDAPASIASLSRVGYSLKPR